MGVQRAQFVQSRRQRWERLETLLRQSRRSNPGRLSGEELLELGHLYRSATSDLAIARRDFPDDRIVVYLNGLVGRAHPLVYRGRVMDLNRVGYFVRYGFPEAFRGAWPYVTTAFALFLAAAVVSAVLVAVRPSMADVLLPGKAQQLRSVMEQHHLWMKSATEDHSVAANFIMLNNIQVAFFAFAGGILLGLGTIYEMILNGINMGVVGAMVAQYGLSEGLWSFVVPHGVIELSVIFIAGGAGLMLGDAIVRPGLRSRQDALVRSAHRAAELILGCVPLLVLAGTIEGFFSPSDAPDALKYAFGAVVGMALYSYLLLSRPAMRPPGYTFKGVLNEPEPVSAGGD